MARHLIDAGHPLTVFTRTQAKAESLIEAGAKRTRSPEETPKDENFVCTMVGFPCDLEEVALGERGVALVHELYLSCQALGAGRKGTQALYLALRHVSGLN